MDGIRVLDLSIMLTGPYAAALLADQGAEVIKVERPGIGDYARHIGASVNGMSALFLVCNRGRRSIAVDLQQIEGQEIVLQLAEDSDVVIQNFRPGVIDRLGLGYERVRDRNPDVVYLSISAFGSEGPYRGRGAYDPVIQAYAGIAMTQADQHGTPGLVRQTVADKVTSLYACQAVTAALFVRARGRGGQHVELSMMDAAVSFQWSDAAGNEVLVASDHSLPSSVATGFEPIRYADGWGTVLATSDENFSAMCRAFGVAGADDPRVATMAARAENRKLANEIVDMCHAMAANLTVAEATQRLDAERLPFAMFLSPEQLITEPHAVAVGLLEEQHHPTVGPVRLPRHPARFASTRAALRGPAPDLGQHTDEILAELGLADRIEDLRNRAVVA
jgi:crotonobetainyl-CoA:carnitine CoA-transferase CaiB-like acyl-CoA transferase